jgi:hypothetical protein
METFISMRALAASPLMMGGDLPTLDDFSLKLITDPDMLACNQNGIMASLVVDDAGLETWRVNKRGTNKKGWIGLFNRLDESVSVELQPARLGVENASYKIKDIWKNVNRSFGSTVVLEPNGVLFVKFKE